MLQILLVLLALLLSSTPTFAQPAVSIVDNSTGQTVNPGDATNQAQRVNCVLGCPSSTTDNDDGSLAAGQTAPLGLGLTYFWNGATWARWTGANTISNGAGASAVNVQDGGNSLTVDGTVAATQSGTWAFRAQDGTGNAITSQTAGALRPWHVIVTDTSGNPITSFGGSGGMSFGWEEELADYKNKVNLAAGTIMGAKKTRFNGRDFGVIAVDTYAAAV
jgi:hypothetical protein